MKVIGITGGVGAGKSEVLAWLGKRPDCRVIMADQVAHRLEEPGEVCFEPLRALLGDGILDVEGRIDKRKMAVKIFGDETLLKSVNEIVHPAVKTYLTTQIEKERTAGKLNWLFIEAALLIEEGYVGIVDELWYIHAGEDVRRRRLKSGRGYTDEKIDSIFRSQLSEEAFRKHCDVVIENSGTLESVYTQIEKELGEEQWQKR